MHCPICSWHKICTRTVLVQLIYDRHIAPSYHHHHQIKFHIRIKANISSIVSNATSNPTPPEIPFSSKRYRDWRLTSGPLNASALPNASRSYASCVFVSVVDVRMDRRKCNPSRFPSGMRLNKNRERLTVKRYLRFVIE